MRILVLNGGSSSFKYALYEISQDDAPTVASQPLFREDLERLGTECRATLEPVLRRAGSVDAVGHRIVHGGSYRAATWITPEVRAAISGQAEVAPAHNRLELEAIDTVEAVLGTRVRQAAGLGANTGLYCIDLRQCGTLIWYMRQGGKKHL